MSFTIIRNLDQVPSYPMLCKLAERNHVRLTGNEHSGSFSCRGVEGDYQIGDQDIRGAFAGHGLKGEFSFEISKVAVTLTDKPFWLPEMFLKQKITEGLDRVCNELSRATFMMTTVDEKLGFIFERRSIRVYSPGEVSEENVRKLLAAAMAAPSAAAKYPWRFVVVRNRQTLSRIAAVLPHGQMLTTAALGIVVCGDLEVAHDGQLSYLLQDCSAAGENLLLCAHVLGLGACWLGVHPRTERIKGLREILTLPQSVIPVACISVGLPGESKEPNARYDPDAVHFEKW